MPLLTRTCRYERMNIERFFARAFVVAGGVTWIAAFFGAPYAYRGATLFASTQAALAPLAFTVVVFLLALVYETLTAAVLLTGAAAVAVYGTVAGWEPGVWVTAGVFLIAPMIIGGLLFLLAARMQEVCELEESREAS